MAIHSSKSFEMPLLLSAFSNVLPQVICGQIIGRECDTAPGEVRRGLLLYGRHFSSTGGSAGRWLQRFYTTGGGRFGPIISNYPCFSYVTLTSLARKRTDDSDSEIGWRPAPEKNIETAPCWGKNSPENCLVDLGRDTRTSTQSRRLVRRKGASWSLNWPSGANLLVHLLLKCILYVPL